MTLKIQFSDNTVQTIAISKGENVQQVVKAVCRMNRWDVTLISDYWIEQ